MLVNHDPPLKVHCLVFMVVLRMTVQPRVVGAVEKSSEMTVCVTAKPNVVQSVKFALAVALSEKYRWERARCEERLSP